MIDRLILIRHGETMDNLRGVAQGWSDSDLSPKGRQQVDRVAARLATMRPAALWCSTLPRAIRTAEAIGEQIGLEPAMLDDLREMHCGEWEGVSFLEVRRSQPDVYRRWAASPHEPCPGGESYHDVRQRMIRAMERVDASTNGTPVTVAVVSHSTAIRVLATALLELPLESARNLAQDNAALNLFEFRKPRWILRTWNDTTHCNGLEQE